LGLVVIGTGLDSQTDSRFAAAACDVPSAGEGITDKGILLNATAGSYNATVSFVNVTVGLENASGTVAARYSYNGSTLLSAWEGIYTATAGATGQIEFLDTTPSDTAPRFYRAVAVP
jgi:hypothetical protein